VAFECDEGHVIVKYTGTFRMAHRHVQRSSFNITPISRGGVGIC